MNILFVTPYYYPESGGLENYAHEIAKGLLSEGHRITALCANKNKKSIAETVDGVSVIRQKPDLIVSNTPIKFALYWDLCKLIKEGKFDAIMGHTPVPFYADMACYAAKKCKVPFILTYHNDSVHPNWLVDILASGYNYTFNLLTLHSSTKIITPSPFCFQESKFLKKYKEKVVLIPPGVDLGRFKPERNEFVKQRHNLPKDSKVILFVGQLGKFHKHKGVDVLIDAFSAVLKDMPSAYLVLVGKGDAVEYRRQADEKGVKGRVIFAGFVTNDDLPKYYQSSDVLVLPTTTEQEGFGMTLIEAMACGTSVIGSRIGGIRYVIEDGKTGMLFEPGNSNALAASLIKSLGISENKNTNNAIRTAYKYSWNEWITRTEELLK